MTIRKATTADLPGIRDCGRRLLDQTPYRDEEIDVMTLGQTLGQCIASALGFAMVAEHEGKVTGMLLGIVQPLWYSKARAAHDLVIYSERPGDGIKMIRKFLDWAWNIPGVIEVTVSQSSGIEPERFRRMMEDGLHMEYVGGLFTLVRAKKAGREAA